MKLDKEKIEWTPASSLGASFCTHTLSTENPQRLEFVPTTGMKLFYFTFCSLTYTTPLFFLAGFIAGEVPVWALLLVFAVTYLFWFCCKYLKSMTYAPKYFDTSKNQFYHLESSLLGVQKEITETISAIEALQILPKTIHSSNERYTAYELNLVLNSGQRRTLLSHSSYHQIKQDAQTLSKYLGLEVLEKT